MVSGYWFGIHKVSGAADNAQGVAAKEAAPVITPAVVTPATLAPELIVYDFSDIDCGDAGDPLHSPAFDPLEKAEGAPELDAPYSWIDPDLAAKTDATPPAVKDSSATA